MDDAIVIVGGGHATAALCLALAERGLADKVVVFSEESVLPYERPELSKSFLTPDSPVLASLLPETWFEQHGAKFFGERRVVDIDCEQRTVLDHTGEKTAYGKLVLATGAQARSLPHLPPELSNVFTLRDLRDAVRLREALEKSRELTVVGAGFVGLEVAAAARQMGKAVQVLESGAGILGRSVSARLAKHVQALHEDKGIRIRTGATIGGVVHDNGVLEGMEIDGEFEPIEMLFLGVGALPRMGLALRAGLACDNGITVDHFMTTSNPDILAIGDCVRYFCAQQEQWLRLESVQSANEQAKCAAAVLAGEAQEQGGYGIVPWFWSDQGEVRLQMAGLAQDVTQSFVRPAEGANSFSILHYAKSGKLCMVESLNCPSDHTLLRRILQSGRSLPAEKLADSTLPLKSLLKAAIA